MLDTNFPDELRRNCRLVSERATSVRILHERLPGYAARIRGEEFGPLRMDPALHFLGRGSATVAFILTLDAVNFGSGFFPFLLDDPSRSGYAVIASSLTRRFRERGPLSAWELSGVSGSDCALLFSLNTSDPLAAELAELLARSLRETGTYILDRFQGSFENLIQEAGESAVGLAVLLAAIPSFRDIQRYAELELSFMKRGQIAAADLFIAFGGEGPGRFRDIERLTVFADNLLPHVLRLDGLLEYHPDLARRIDRGEPLAPGSPEEVEIRACSVHASEVLLLELGKIGKEVSALALDNYLWHRGQKPFFRRRPRHRVRTPFY